MQYAIIINTYWPHWRPMYYCSSKPAATQSSTSNVHQSYSLVVIHIMWVRYRSTACNILASCWAPARSKRSSGSMISATIEA